MRKICFLLLCGLVFSCEEKPKPQGDFNDRILEFAIGNPEDKWIELPDLYGKTTVQIPPDSTEKFILAEKLQAKGFKITHQSSGNYSVSGMKAVNVTLNKGICDCEVSKVYYPTPYESQYIVTEKIKCRDVSK